MALVGNERLFICEYLESNYQEFTPMSFYRFLFPEGELEEKGVYETGKYNAIATEIIEKQGGHNKNYVITDGLEVLPKLLKSNNFIVIPPVTFVGKRRTIENARKVYAIAIDLDGIVDEVHLRSLFKQMDVGHIPTPTAIVWSGSGMHLYYMFSEAIHIFGDRQPILSEQLKKLKDALTRKIWNDNVTVLYKPGDVQIESVYQGFRMVGSVTKEGTHRARAFLIGEKVDMEYLNSFVEKQYRYGYELGRDEKTSGRRKKIPLEEAKKKYPKWYESRVLKGMPRKFFTNNAAMYEWWLRTVKEKIRVGHRYYGIMSLAIYAVKCGISKERLYKDAYELVDYLESLTVDENNHFTKQDVYAGLQKYNDVAQCKLCPIDEIERLTGIEIKRNKRNGRSQKKHLILARDRKASLRNIGELEHDGRPSMEERTVMWWAENPTAKIDECMVALSVSKSTAYKYRRVAMEKGCIPKKNIRIGRQN